VAGDAAERLGDPARYEKTYFSQFGKKIFITGDGAKKDSDGYFWLMGRIDDVIKVSGHRIGTAEVESALDSHPDVTESAVVGVKHPIKGQALYAFVTPKAGVKIDEAKLKEIRNHVGIVMDPLRSRTYVQIADGLPKTRSGKIMRRVLKALVNHDEVGDTTTARGPFRCGYVGEGEVDVKFFL